MKIAIIGTGYVGLVAGACFAEWGFDVTCVDKDNTKIVDLKAGILPFYEPGLDAIIANNISRKKLWFTSDLSSAVCNANIIFITVGTPLNSLTGQIDLSDVFSVAQEIAPLLDSYKIIVVKSTVPVGTTRQLANIIRKKNPLASFDIVSHPEFLREGTALNDFMHPNRLVIGTENEDVKQVVHSLYTALSPSIPCIDTTLETAELIKYTANAFLATKVAFINQIADLCEQCEANIKDLSLGIGLDQRIGKDFLTPGPGFGGACLPKDTVAMLQTSQQFKVHLTILESVIIANEKRKKQIAELVISAVGDSVKGKNIAILGLTFKANTDDVRESPCLKVVPALTGKGATIKAYDPKGMKNAKKVLPDIFLSATPYEAVEGADAIVVLTKWDIFQSLNLKRIKKLVRTPILLDFVNIYNPNILKKLGFTYYSLGQKPVFNPERKAKIKSTIAPNEEDCRINKKLFLTTKSKDYENLSHRR